MTDWVTAWGTFWGYSTISGGAGGGTWVGAGSICRAAYSSSVPYTQRGCFVAAHLQGVFLCTPFITL